MKHTLAALAFATLVACRVAQACAGPDADKLGTIEYAPYAASSTMHWPSELDVSRQTFLAFLVPFGTIATVSEAVPEEKRAPVVVMTPRLMEGFSPRLKYPRGKLRVAFDPAKYVWVHVFAQSPGTARLTLTAPDGWSHALDLRIVSAREDEPGLGAPNSLRLRAGAEPSLSLGPTENAWVSVPGKVTDRWSVVSASGGSLELDGIVGETVHRNEAPRVRLLLKPGSPMPSGRVLVKRQSAGGRVEEFRFRVEVYDPPFCILQPSEWERLAGGSSPAPGG
jgi:hypothetical protein